MTGPHTLHKEELTMSNAERSVKSKVEENARIQQRKRSSMMERQSERGGGGGENRSGGKRSPVSLSL